MREKQQKNVMFDTAFHSTALVHLFCSDTGQIFIQLRSTNAFIIYL